MPLKKAGMKPSIPNFLEECYKLVKYAKKALSFDRVSYLVTWREIFMVPRSKCWRDELLIIKLLFTVPVSIVKLERMFSKLKCVETNFH